MLCPRHLARSSSTFATLVVMALAIGCKKKAPTPSPAPPKSELSGPMEVRSCARATFRTTDGAAVSSWEVIGMTTAALERTASSAVSIRFPAVARPTSARVVATLERNGTSRERTTHVMIQPGASPNALPSGLAPGCAPFAHGVASGDPEPERVVLWTHHADAAREPVTLTWQVSEANTFDEIVRSGSVSASPEQGGAVKVDVTSLEPGTTYYYRFIDSTGHTSPTGRTQTAGIDDAEFVAAVASCSSIYSGFFNAYARIADRDDLDLVIHLGDYLYDFVDEDEEVRVPESYPTIPKTLGEWRARHAYYLMDPDLRRARAAHPWSVLWDNHDLSSGDPAQRAASIRAFHEWLPTRPPRAEEPRVFYRAASFGGSVDVIFIDGLLWRDKEQTPGSEAMSILGEEQFSWLDQALEESEGRWRLLATQRVISTVRVNKSVRGDDVFDRRTWDGYPRDRARLHGLLERHGHTSHNVVIAGDSHISVAMDLATDPMNAEAYDPVTGRGSMGVELLPSSITRGNFDEELGLLAFDGLLESIRDDTLGRNAHLRFLELTRHGYGVLTFTKEGAKAQIFYVPKETPDGSEELGVELEVDSSGRRWRAP